MQLHLWEAKGKESREGILEFKNTALIHCFNGKVKPGSFTTNHQVMSQGHDLSDTILLGNGTHLILFFLSLRLFLLIINIHPSLTLDINWT